MKRIFLFQILLLTLLCPGVLAQQPKAPTPLADLLAEAKQNNARLEAAKKAVEAEGFAPKQAGAFPDTELIVQTLSVGDPRLIAGYDTSDFAYIGLGASQELPYPGKRRLRTTVAEHEVAVRSAEGDMVLADVMERLKVAYFELAASQGVLQALERNKQVIDDLEQAVQIRYRVGQGTQQDVLRAQLERTKLLNEVTLQRRTSAQLQAQIKELLNRPAGSADIIPEALSPRRVHDLSPLFEKLPAGNPESRVSAERTFKSTAAVELAIREKKPDFGVQYMWQHTSDNFRDYYMATFTLRLPNRKRVMAAESEAIARRTQAEAEQAAVLRSAQSALDEQIAIVENTDQQLAIYDQGLIPQTQAAFQAGLAGYRSGKQEYQGLLSSYADTLRLSIEYLRTVAEHEIAIARIERLTGEELK
jgi:outer membrane protein TolC